MCNRLLRKQDWLETSSPEASLRTVLSMVQLLVIKGENWWVTDRSAAVSRMFRQGGIKHQALRIR